MFLQFNKIFSNIPKSRIIIYAVISVLFTSSFLFPYSTNSNSYDPIFFVYFLLFSSFFLFLYLDFKDEKEKEFTEYKDLAFAMIILSIFVAVTFKLLIIPSIIKLGAIFTTLFLFLLIMHRIRKS